MPDKQALRERAYIWTTAIIQRPDSQHHLMLLWLQSLQARGLFTEVQKAADLISEIGQGPKIGSIQVWNGLHFFIISYHDMISQATASARQSA